MRALQYVSIIFTKYHKKTSNKQHFHFVHNIHIGDWLINLEICHFLKVISTSLLAEVTTERF